MDISGYLIEKYNNMTGAYTCNRIVKEATEAGIDLKIIGIHDTYVCDGKLYNKGKELEKRDFVINRYKWGKLKDEISLLGVRSYNNLDAYNIYVNKYEQVKRLWSDAFIIPKYLMGSAKLPFHEVASRLGLPFVAKGLESSMGEEINLVENETDYKALLTKYGEIKEWLYEEFITTSYGKDMRFYSIRGKAVACMERRSNGDFRANVALGASVRPLDVTPDISRIASDIYRQTGLDFLGIDLMYGTDKPYFCEINVMPGLEGIEASSGLNIAKMIIDTVKGDFECEQTRG